MDCKRVSLADEGLRKEYGDVKVAVSKMDLEGVDDYCRGKNEAMLKILKNAGWME